LNAKCFTNNTNNTNNIKDKRNKTKYTEPILSFLELGASSCQAAPGSPGLDFAADRDWTQGCTDWNLDQDRRQDKKQDPLQKAAMDEESKTLVIPQL